MARIFKHYKTGNLYEYVGEAKHSENLGTLVLYKSMLTGELWARPWPIFFEKVKNAVGLEVPRFEEVKNEL